MESEAVAEIMEFVDAGRFELVSSEITEIELAATTDAERRRRMFALLPASRDRILMSESVLQRAKVVARLGFQPADATHVASAEAARADVLLACDDQFCRVALRNQKKLAVRVANPIDWLKEMHGDAHIG